MRSNVSCVLIWKICYHQGPKCVLLSALSGSKNFIIAMYTHVHKIPLIFFCSLLLLTKTSGKEEASMFGSWESHRESLRIQYMRWKEEKRRFFSILNPCSTAFRKFCLLLLFSVSLYLNNIEIFLLVRRDELRKNEKRRSSPERMGRSGSEWVLCFHPVLLLSSWLQREDFLFILYFFAAFAWHRACRFGIIISLWSKVSN